VPWENGSVQYQYLLQDIHLRLFDYCPVWFICNFSALSPTYPKLSSFKHFSWSRVHVVPQPRVTPPCDFGCLAQMSRFHRQCIGHCDVISIEELVTGNSVLIPAFIHISPNPCFRDSCKRLKHITCCLKDRKLYRLVGQSYAGGIMRYSGNLNEDIQNGKVEVEHFLVE
jgi:hypothetical protein